MPDSSKEETRLPWPRGAVTSSSLETTRAREAVFSGRVGGRLCGVVGSERRDDRNGPHESWGTGEPVGRYRPSWRTDLPGRVAVGNLSRLVTPPFAVRDRIEHPKDDDAEPLRQVGIRAAFQPFQDLLCGDSRRREPEVFRQGFRAHAPFCILNSRLGSHLARASASSAWYMALRMVYRMRPNKTAFGWDGSRCRFEDFLTIHFVHLFLGHDSCPGRLSLPVPSVPGGWSWDRVSARWKKREPTDFPWLIPRPQPRSVLTPPRHPDTVVAIKIHSY